MPATPLRLGARANRPTPSRPARVAARRLAVGCLSAVAAILCGAPAAGADFVAFESGQVRPLALSADGRLLFAVNTPDARLEIFAVDAAGLTHADSVAVGLEPVAVAVRNATEVWVVNHLSDSVSVVDVGTRPPRVVRTLLVGDEPRDIVFAGTHRSRAFVSAAHRGQNLPADPQLTTPGVGRADVWVFAADDLGSPAGGTPLAILNLFGDSPGALAASPDGNIVYASVFQSGNQTTTIPEASVCDGGAAAPPCTVEGVTVPGGLPPPNTSAERVRQPETGLIVRYDPRTGNWLDPVGRDWSAAVRFSLPDRDVFAVDAAATPPVEVGAYAHVGTVLFGMATNPANGKVYVANTEARNEVRFEGAGTFGGSSVRGHLHESRITVLDADGASPRRLNKHIDYDVVPSPAGVKERSLATPVGLAVSSDGATLYVAAFGSAKIGVLDSAALEDDSFEPDAGAGIPLAGGGPSGLVLDEPRRRLYVLTRFDNSVSALDLDSRTEIARLPLFNPEPPAVVAGRPFLYDATLTSSNGEASCSSCHVFGNLDGLAWDLGDPDGGMLPNPNPSADGFLPAPFHPMKGPMTTQTLRGMATHGPLHWRGDRTGGNDPGGDPLSAEQGFRKFNGAFPGLLGRTGTLEPSEMEAFGAFAMQIAPPPNPVRNLDNSLTVEQTEGRDFFLNFPVEAGEFRCRTCHVLDPAHGLFGTSGRTAFLGKILFFKIPHLRNLYEKVGMFAASPQGPLLKPEQVRGFGFTHDGSQDTLLHFVTDPRFDFPAGDSQRRSVEQFLLAFDSNLAPIVGQQLTLGPLSGADAQARIDLIEQRAAAGECGVVVRGLVGGDARGWIRMPDGVYRPDDVAGEAIDAKALRALAALAGQELTFTAVPPGSEVRMGLDRDRDGALDFDEIAAGTDPADPLQFPPLPATPTISVTSAPTATSTSMPRSTPTRPSSPTSTPSITATASASPTHTPPPSPTPTSSPTSTPSASPSSTATSTPSSTAAITATETAAPTPPATPTGPPTETPTGTPIPTSSPTSSASPEPSPSPSPSPTVSSTSTPPAPPTPTPTSLSSCPGDCDGDGGVTVEEIVRGVNIALGVASPDSCPGFSMRCPEVCVDELVAAVGNALRGCP